MLAAVTDIQRHRPQWRGDGALSPGRHRVGPESPHLPGDLSLPFLDSFVNHLFCQQKNIQTKEKVLRELIGVKPMTDVEKQNLDVEKTAVSRLIL